MNQPSTEGTAPQPLPKKGCLRMAAQTALFLVVVTGVVAMVVWQRNEAARRSGREANILQELQPLKNSCYAAVRDHADVKTALGEPVDERGVLRREGSGELDRANARFSFSIAGPKGNAVVAAVAKQVDGNWKVSEIKVQVAGAQTIDVPPPIADAPPEIDF